MYSEIKENAPNYGRIQLEEVNTSFNDNFGNGYWLAHGSTFRSAVHVNTSVPNTRPSHLAEHLEYLVLLEYQTFTPY